jgi:hypothetical protein
MTVDPEKKLDYQSFEFIFRNENDQENCIFGRENQLMNSRKNGWVQNGRFPPQKHSVRISATEKATVNPMFMQNAEREKWWMLKQEWHGTR